MPRVFFISLPGNNFLITSYQVESSNYWICQAFCLVSGFSECSFEVCEGYDI